MKRSWIGLALLLLLLAGGIGATAAMVQVCEPVSRDLEQAAQLALAEDWAGAEFLLRQTRENWDAWAGFRACFADHTPIEQIDATLQLLEVYCAARENAAFAAEAASLAKQIAAVGEAHEFSWRNFF